MKTTLRTIIVTLSVILPCVSIQASENIPLYKNPDASIETRVDDLLSRMTLEEKILQLNMYILGENSNINNIGEINNSFTPGIGSYIYFNNTVQLRNEFQKKEMESSRLGIPILFGFDVIHGFQTIFPIPLAQSCSWNPTLVQTACAVAAQESRMSGVDWTFSPMIDVARDGRWGRISEGYGEDPYTNGIFATAAVKGYQGDTLSSHQNVASCLKHFAGYGVSQGGRDYEATDISRQTLWDTYLPPYEAGIQAGAATVMSGFNDLSGVPVTANKYLLTDVLKKKWGFNGFVVSDWNAVEQLISQGIAQDRKEAARLAFNSGVEIDMKDFCYKDHLKQLIKEGKVSESQINEAVSRILKLKFQLGLFEKPYTEVLPQNKRVLLPTSLDIAEKLAEESMVLLKNANNTLPLRQKKIAIIGPMAKDKENLLGSWSAHGNASDVESIYEGLKNEFSKDIILNYALGCEFDGDDKSGFSDALTLAVIVKTCSDI